MHFQLAEGLRKRDQLIFGERLVPEHDDLMRIKGVKNLSLHRVRRRYPAIHPGDLNAEQIRKGVR